MYYKCYDKLRQLQVHLVNEQERSWRDWHIVYMVVQGGNSFQKACLTQFNSR